MDDAPVTPLFRPQALESTVSRRYGHIVLARPVSYAFLTGLFTAIAVAIIGFFTAFGYSRKVQVPGVLLPASGLVRVVAPQVGVVAERQVREGQVVKAGDPLFILTSERASVTRGDAESAISSLLRSRRDSLLADRGQLQRQSEQRLEAVRRHADDLAQDVRRIDAQIILQQRRTSLAEAAVRRAADLQAQNFVSAAQVQDRQGEWLDQQLRLADLQRARASSARDLASAQAELRDQKIQTLRDQEGATRNIASLDQDLTENEARRQVVIRASQGGVVSAIAADPGQTVSTGQVVASLLPRDAPLIAELYAPSRAAGFVKPGMDVLVRYQAYPYQKFGLHHGRVREVSSTAMRPDQMSLPGAATTVPGSGEPLYRVRVALDEQSVAAYGDHLPLKSGMVLDASVVLENRRLYEWVLEPLYTVTGRL